MPPVNHAPASTKMPVSRTAALLGGTLEFIPLTNRSSLRQRFLLYLGSLFLLLSILGGVSYYTLQATVDNFDQAINQELLYLRQQIYLRDLVTLTNNPVYQYISYGDAQERLLYKDIQSEANDLFIEILDNTQLSGTQKELIHNSYQEWQKATTTAMAILSPTQPMEKKATQTLLETFNNYTEGTIDILYESHNINLKNIEMLRTEANSNFIFTQSITLAGFITGIITFITAIIAMFRFVLQPAQSLLQSMESFGRGDLRHRIKVTSTDEFGALAVGFNRMAENLERDQAKLAELAIRDSLTGLYNRREFERLLNDEIHRFRRHGHPVSLLIIDIDHFKQINDRYGHQVGDEALRTVADIITNESRTGDVIARYGGEELAVILPETGAENATILAERTCQAIAEFPVMISPKEVIPITVSIGAATVPDNANAARDLVTAADLAMYEAKRNGRNCVRSATNAHNHHE
jgi:diguanylate cyclase (GGDEF)-like protein